MSGRGSTGTGGRRTRLQARAELAILAALIVVAAMMRAGHEPPSSARPAIPRSHLGRKITVVTPEEERRSREALEAIREDMIRQGMILAGRPRPLPAPISVSEGPELPRIAEGQYAVVWTPLGEEAGSNVRVTVIARPPNDLLDRIRQIRFWRHWYPGSGPWRAPMELGEDGLWVGHAVAPGPERISGIRPLVEVLLAGDVSCEITGDGEAPTELGETRSFLERYRWTFRER